MLRLFSVLMRDDLIISSQMIHMLTLQVNEQHNIHRNLCVMLVGTVILSNGQQANK